MQFKPEDLERLDKYILQQAEAVVSLREVWAGNRVPKVIGMRHDIDNYPGAFECGLRLAKWEAARGYRSTYYLLHTAEYWKQPTFGDVVTEIASLGHEIGLHNDALGAAVLHGGDPHDIFATALQDLRNCDVTVRSTVAHGNRELTALGARNDELFYGCERPSLGKAYRYVDKVRIVPRQLSEYGLDFEAARTLGRALELTDSGGDGWNNLEETERKWPRRGQMHINQHPDWWTEAV